MEAACGDVSPFGFQTNPDICLTCKTIVPPETVQPFENGLIYTLWSVQYQYWQ